MANTSIWWFIIQSWFDMTDMGQILFSKVSEYIGPRNTIPMESGCKCDAGADALESDLRWRHLWPEIDTCLARVEKPPRVRQRKSSTPGSTHNFLSNLPNILKNTVTHGGSYFVEDELVAHVTIQKLPSLGLEPEVVVWDFQLKYV